MPSNDSKQIHSMSTIDTHTFKGVLYMYGCVDLTTFLVVILFLMIFLYFLYVPQKAVRE